MRRYRRFGDFVDKAISFIEERRLGYNSSLKTSLPKLDAVLLDGIPPNRILTIAGMSGSGKSIFSDQLIDDFVKNDQRVKVLSIELEMAGTDIALRQLSANTGIDSGLMLSSNKRKLSAEDYAKVIETGKILSEREIYIVDEPVSVSSVEEVIRDFMVDTDFYNDDYFLVVKIDYVSLLDKDKVTDNELSIVTALYKILVNIKKEISNKGKRVLFVCLSQLNRDIESTERLKPENQHPLAKDLFAASAVQFGSDYVVIIHNPSKLNLVSFGVKREPVKNEEGLPIIYIFIKKNRFGREGYFPAIGDFAKGKIAQLQCS